MRNPLSVRDREVLEQALRDLDRVIGLEYPEAKEDDLLRESDFRWGIGDGFRMALRGVVDAALPGWQDR